MSNKPEIEANSEEPSTASQMSTEDKQTTTKCCPNCDESAAKSGQTCNAKHSSVKHKLRSLAFGRRKNSLQCFANNKCKQNNCNNNESINRNTNCNNRPKKKKSSAVWVPFKMCARTESCADVTQVDNTYTSCVCTAYKKTEEQEANGSEVLSINTTNVCNNSSQNIERMNGLKANPEIESNFGLNALQTNESNQLMDYSSNESYAESGLGSYEVNGSDTYTTPSVMSEVRSVQVRVSELALALRSQLALTVSPYPYLARWGEVAELTPGFLNRFCVRSDSSQALSEGQQIHTQIDYVHCLVPDLLQITNCSFYWGKMDRYEAERLLDNKPEGTFLLRDSAQEEHLFSVSFRRFDRSLHARIEQWNHRFSFDSHDPGVYASSTVCGLIEHYKDPSHCMFFEPMLTIPLHRNFTFSLQHLSRAAITSHLTYDTIHSIQLPKRLKNYLKEYHYKQQVRVRRLDGDH